MLSNLATRFRSLTTLTNGFILLKKGHIRIFLEELRKRLYSNSRSVGLRRDLTIPFQSPDAKIPISIRPIKDGDFQMITQRGNVSEMWPRIVQQRQSMIDADLQTCYITVTERGEPCYMQWLMGPDQNEKIKALFGDTFPVLNPDEALLEAAFMHPDYRGLRIMPAAMSRIAEKAVDLGARYTITFVDIENIPSLKGCRRSGFYPYVLRKDHWFLFRRKITFEPVPDAIQARYDETTSESGERRSGHSGRTSSGGPAHASASSGDGSDASTRPGPRHAETLSPVVINGQGATAAGSGRNGQSSNRNGHPRMEPFTERH